MVPQYNNLLTPHSRKTEFMLMQQGFGNAIISRVAATRFLDLEIDSELKLNKYV